MSSYLPLTTPLCKPLCSAFAEATQTRHGLALRLDMPTSRFMEWTGQEPRRL
jgi:hypothetical protein